MNYHHHRLHCSHPQHYLVRSQYREKSGHGHVCDLCGGGCSGLIGYRCEACDFDIHEACADHFQPAIYFFAHTWPHSLALGRVADDNRICDLCTEGCPRGSLVYRCVPCGFDVHPLCSTLRAAVRSPLHPQHELGVLTASSLRPGQFYLCSACGELCSGWFYSCGFCGVGLHVNCLNGASAKQRDGGGSQSNSGGGGGDSQSSRVGNTLLDAAVSVAVDAATSSLASAVLDSVVGSDDTAAAEQ
ncbi:hypothetical protein ABZP36_002089 [Zizania latifolia]